jgi:hypothetical protein
VTSGNPYKRPPHYFEPERRDPRYCKECMLREKAPVHISTSIHEFESYPKPERPDVDHLFKQLDEGEDTSMFNVGFWAGLLVGGLVATTFWAIVYQLFL